MSDHKEHNASKFSGFEPPVTDARINENWNKIKYFLPNEKKRRGLLFFNRSVVFMCLSAGLLLLGIIIFNDVNGDSDRTQVGTSLARLNDSSGFRIAGAGDTDPGGSEKTGRILANSGRVSVAVGASPDQKRIPAALLEKPSLPFGNRSGRPAISSGRPQHQNREPELTASTQAVVLKDSGSPVIKGSDSVRLIPFNSLDFAGLLARSDSEKISPETTKGLPLFMPGARHAILLEFTTGINETFADIKNRDLNSRTLNKQTNFYAGIGIIYRLKNKWHLAGNIAGGTNMLNYGSEAIGNRIVAPQSPQFIAVIAGSPVKYVEVDTKTTIQARYSYNLQLGAGYAVFQRGRFAVDLCLQLGLRFASYDYSRISHINADTLVYYQPQSMTPLSNTVTTTESKYDTHFKVMSFGFVPGVAFSYGITERMALVFKSTYFGQISKTKINAAQVPYDLSQNNLYLGIGLRLKL